MPADPILIVGAGPVGLTAAAMLARFKVPVRIIDPLSEPTSQSRALVVWRRTLQVLDPIISHHRFLESRHVVDSVNFHINKKQIAKLLLKQEGRGIPGGVFIPQSATEALLLEALSSLGVDVERQKSLVSFSSRQDGVDVTLETPTGSESISTPWLIACDGGKSVVRHQLKLKFPGHTVSRDYALADMVVDRDERLDQLHVEFSKQGVAVFFPIGERLWRIFIDRGPLVADREQVAPTVEELQQLIDQRTSRNWTIQSVPWRVPYHVNERQIENYVHGRVLLAGDSAHVHSPAGGQGLNIGIQDAANLAWKLALVVQGVSSPQLIETYQAERHPIGKNVVKASSLALNAASKNNVLVRGLRRVLLKVLPSIKPIGRKLASMITEDVTTYARGPMGGKKLRGATHGPGDQMPDLKMSINGQPGVASDLCLGTGATLISFFTPLAEYPRHFGANGQGLQLDVVHLDSSSSQNGKQLAEAFGLRSGGLILVRPDGVVATVSQGLEEVEQWMNTHLAA